MGWYAAWRLIEECGGPDNVPPAKRREVLKGEADPSRTWASAVNKYDNEKRLRDARHDRRRRIAAIRAEGPC